MWFALQETDVWNVTRMQVPGCVCNGWDSCRTAILCPRQDDWVHDDSVCLHAAPWYDEENKTSELEVVKIIMEEGKVGGPGHFHWRRRQHRAQT